MPLTVGKLGETRRLGGSRGALRTEIRRAERKGNTGLANALGGELAKENIRRAGNGDSLIGSSDSDAREQVASRQIGNNLLAEGARLASSPTLGTSNPGFGLSSSGEGPTLGTTTSGFGLGQGTPGGSRDSQTTPTLGATTSGFGLGQGVPTSPLKPAQPPGTIAAGGSTPPTPAPEGVAQAAAQAATQAATQVATQEADLLRPPAAPQKLSRPEGFINDVPAAEALGAARSGAQYRQALDRGELIGPDTSPDVNQRGELRRRKQFLSDFEGRHGRDALLEQLGSRSDEGSARNAESRRLAVAREDAAVEDSLGVDNVLLREALARRALRQKREGETRNRLLEDQLKRLQ